MPELETPVDGWNITETAFPRNGTDEEKLKFLLRYAVLAPSSRNSQPWLFRLTDGGVELYADPSRSLLATDPDGREMLIACGAALQFLRVAVRHFGYADEVETFPDPEDTDLLARVKLGGAREPSAQDELLFWAIPKRHTNRQPFLPARMSESLLSALQDDARSENAWLHVVDDLDARYGLANLIAEGDHVQWADQQYRAELAEWVRSNHSQERDGLPGYALGMNDLEAGIAPLIIGAFDLSSTASKKDYKLAVAGGVLVVLGTDSDEPQSWLAAGQGLGKLLLRASAEGVAASYFNQPIEIDYMRPLLARTLGTSGFPQLIMRMGYGSEVKPTPRRPVSEVLI